MVQFIKITVLLGFVSPLLILAACGSCSDDSNPETSNPDAISKKVAAKADANDKNAALATRKTRAPKVITDTNDSKVAKAIASHDSKDPQNKKTAAVSVANKGGAPKTTGAEAKRLQPAHRKPLDRAAVAKGAAVVAAAGNTQDTKTTVKEDDKEPSKTVDNNEKTQGATKGVSANNAKAVDVEATIADKAKEDKTAAAQNDVPKTAHQALTRRPNPIRTNNQEPAAKTATAKNSDVASDKEFVSPQQLRSLFKEKLVEARGDLPGKADDSSYHSNYFEVGGRKDSYGAGVQVWSFAAGRNANERFSRMKRQYPAVAATEALKTEAFFSQYAGILQLVFMDESKRHVVAVSCGRDVCSHKELFQLAQDVQKGL